MIRKNSCSVSVLFAMVLSFFILAGVVFGASGSAFALNPQSVQGETSIPGPLELGMVGMTSTETVRLNIVQLPAETGSASDSSPCAVVLNFYDNSGNLLKSQNVTALSDGQAAYLDLNGNALMSSNPAAFTSGRAEIRGEVVNLLDPLIPPTPSRCAVSLEVFDTGTGMTSVLWAHPPMPTLSISSNATQESALDAKLSGNDTTAITTMATVIPSPKISVNPMSVNLGSVKVGGQSSPRPINIKNTGKANLHISAITSTDIEFSPSTNCTNTDITPGNVCTLNVTFSPTNPFGKRTATLVIVSNDPKKPTINVKLLGQAPPPKISISPSSVNFGSVAVGTTSSTKIVTIRNTGTSDLTVNAITITGANATEFSETNNCTTVAKGSSCAITITLSPASAGGESALMSISSNDPKKQVANVKLSGKGSGGSTPGTVNITGSWNYYAEMNGTPGEQGPFPMTLTQSGNGISGTLVSWQGIDWQMTGTIKGLHITGKGVGTGIGVGCTSTITGTVSADGTTMSGNFTANCHGNWIGTFHAAKQ